MIFPHTYLKKSLNKHLIKTKSEIKITQDLQSCCDGILLLFLTSSKVVPINTYKRLVEDTKQPPHSIIISIDFISKVTKRLLNNKIKSFINKYSQIATN